MRIRLGFVVWILMLAACASDAPSSPEPVAGSPDGNEPAGNDPVTGPGPIVTATSSLALSADSICLMPARVGDPTRRDDVRITSVTGTEISGLAATIVYGPGQPTGWLTTSFDQTTTPARLWLSAPTSGIPLGAWWADVKVTAPAGGDARVIRVHYSLRENTGDAWLNVEFGVPPLPLSPGGGRVQAYPGVDCSTWDGGYCAGTQEIGTVLNLTATPAPGSAFLWWEVPGCFHSKNPVCVLTVSVPVTVTAIFYQQAHVTVASFADPVFDLTPGYGTISGGGFSCRTVSQGTCEQDLPIGTVLTLTAAPEPDNAFVLWRGASECTTGSAINTPVCTMTVTGDMKVEAMFALKGYTFTVTAEGPDASGDILATSFIFGLPDNCHLVDGVQSGPCGGYQSYGARTTTLEARPLPGNVFLGWSGDCSGMTCIIQPLPGGSRAVTATFARQAP